MDSQRLDKWLWYARFFKSRSLATKFCASGKLRLNEKVVRKAHYGLRVGDVLTFPRGPHIRVVRVVGLGTRRGPASEAQTLYQDLTPAEPSPRPKPKSERRGKPTKKERRDHARMRRDMLE